MKNITLTNKELKKLIWILGTYRVKMLWCESIIFLNKDQLNYLIEEGKKNE